MFTNYYLFFSRCEWPHVANSDCLHTGLESKSSVLTGRLGVMMENKKALMQKCLYLAKHMED